MNDKDWQPHESVSRTEYVVGLERKVEELEAEQHHKVKEALANSDACWRMEQEFLQRKLAGEAAHIKSLEGLLVDAVRERDKVIEERERARQACNAYWHDLTRIALLCAQTDDEYPLKAVERTVRERDEARAEVSRREREHEALVETAQKALAHVASERDALQAKLDAELPAMWREDLASLNECLERAWRERDEARAEVERLREAMLKLEK